MSGKLVQIAAMLVLVASLASCASSRTTLAESEPEIDSSTQTLSRAANLAYRSARYEQAATLYSETLKSAMERDQWRLIVDARFNLALTASAIGQYKSALAQLDLADAENNRHSRQPDQQVALLRATVDYRRGDLSASDALARRLIASPDTAPDIRSRATFIAALIKAEQKNIDELRRYISDLESIDSDARSGKADVLELKARLHSLLGDIEIARALFDNTIVKRRTEQDYRGMARALAGCAELLESTLPLRAADYFLRAGRSAVQRRDPKARQWLVRARALGEKDSTVEREVNELLLLVAKQG